jgi:DNA-binding NtrC family response regulator
LILIVEDESSLGLLMTKMLQREKFSVLLASNAEEARNRWKECGDRIDLLITDISLADGTKGDQLAAEFRKQREDLPVIFASGNMPEGFDSILESGRCAHLMKPFTSVDLLQIVRSMLKLPT